MKCIILIILFLITGSLMAWNCQEPSWFEIGSQVRPYCINNLDIKITVLKKKDDWVRFNIKCLNEDLDSVYGYAHFVDGNWKMITFGSDIDDNYCKEREIPDYIRE